MNFDLTDEQAAIQKNARKFAQRDFKGLLFKRLTRFKRPKKIIFVESLPRNSVGKVLKKELRKIYE